MPGHYGTRVRDGRHMPVMSRAAMVPPRTP
jgi:hypothetical protein